MAIPVLLMRGYVDDGVSAYQCLSCYASFSVRYGKIHFCMVCGIKFESSIDLENDFPETLKRRWSRPLQPHEQAWPRWEIQQWSNLDNTWKTEWVLERLRAYDDSELEFEYGHRENIQDVRSFDRERKAKAWAFIKKHCGYFWNDPVKWRLVLVAPQRFLSEPLNILAETMFCPPEKRSDSEGKTA